MLWGTQWLIRDITGQATRLRKWVHPPLERCESIERDGLTVLSSARDGAWSFGEEIQRDRCGRSVVGGRDGWDAVQGLWHKDRSRDGKERE